MEGMTPSEAVRSDGFWVGVLTHLLADEPDLRSTVSRVVRKRTSPRRREAGGSTTEDDCGDDADELISGSNAPEDELATLPALLHVLAQDEKRAALMRARVPASGASARKEDEDGEEVEGDSILHFAARRGYTFWCDALLRRDALLDEPNAAQHFTPLHCAIAAGHLRCVRCLVQYGADLGSGDEPLHPSAVDVAKKFGRTEMVDFLTYYMATSSVKPGVASELSVAVSAVDCSHTKKRVLTVGICGATSSGKSTLVKALIKHYKVPSYIRFDNFWKSYNELPREGGYVHGECPDALRYDEFVAYLRSAQRASETNCTEDAPPLLFVDGFLLFCDERYLPLYDIKIFLPITKETCKQRRFSRDPGTSEDYFERIIWPSYRKWNSYPLERWEEIKRSRPSSEDCPLTGHDEGDGGIFFIDGEIDKDQIFREAVRHIDARLRKHQPYQ